MNILFCYRNWMNPNRGGVQRVTDTLARYLIEQGHNLFYLTLQYDESDNYPFPAQLFQLPNPEFFSKSNSVYYHKLIEKFSIDIIINNDASNERARFFLNLGKHKVKKVSFYHNDPLYGLNKMSNSSNFFKKILSKLFPRLIYYYKSIKRKNEINYLLKNSDKLILLSHEFIKELSNKLNINSPKITAISNPCDLNQKQNTIIKKKIILFVARLEFQQKRPDLMLQIWFLLNTKISNWELIILGDGPDRNILEEMSRTMGLKNVKFEGFVNPTPYYENASILCMTSDYEGFGLVLIEAMNYEVVPIVFNNWISLKDIIKDQETGILVPTNDISTYVAKLDQLMSDEAMRSSISANATRHVKNFRIELIGPQWERILEDLVRL